MSPEVCALHPDGCQVEDEPYLGFPGISYDRKPSQAAAEALDAARLREADAFLHAKARIKGCTDGQAARMATVAASGELEVLEARLNIARVQFLLQRG